MFATEQRHLTQREREMSAWNALNIPRDTPQRLRVIASLLVCPDKQHEINAKN